MKFNVRDSEKVGAMECWLELKDGDEIVSLMIEAKGERHCILELSSLGIKRLTEVLPKFGFPLNEQGRIIVRDF